VPLEEEKATFPEGSGTVVPVLERHVGEEEERGVHTTKNPEEDDPPDVPTPTREVLEGSSVRFVQ